MILITIEPGFAESFELLTRFAGKETEVFSAEAMLGRVLAGAEFAIGSFGHGCVESTSWRVWRTGVRKRRMGASEVVDRKGGYKIFDFCDRAGGGARETDYRTNSAVRMD
ncbi:MAG: hypothetical protein JO061_14185 [Acidobacteriaceae bacterium]|nr:hypothetical protein [Acidobacteriaceae bacterium]